MDINFILLYTTHMQTPHKISTLKLIVILIVLIIIGLGLFVVVPTPWSDQLISSGSTTEDQILVPPTNPTADWSAYAAPSGTILTALRFL